jgi:hypothetical protein
MELHSDNLYLRSKVNNTTVSPLTEPWNCCEAKTFQCIPKKLKYFIQMAENERGHEQMGAASTSEYDHVVAVPYDSRNFLQVSIMQQPQHYCHQLQPTTLQLG